MNNIRIILIVSIILIASSLKALAIEIRPNEQYNGETMLESREYGISFFLPSGWKGVYPVGSEFFIMQNQGFGGYVFVNISEMTLRDAQQTMNKDIVLGNGVTFHPKSKVQIRKSVLDAYYHVSGSQSPLVGHIRTIVGKEGSGIIFIAASSETDAPKLETALNTITTSLALIGQNGSNRLNKSNPWYDSLSGRILSPPSSGDYSYNEKYSFTLCPNGIFQYRFFAGGYGQAIQKKNFGRWEVSGGSNSGLLSLSYNNGSVEQYTLAINSRKLYLNDKQYLREMIDCN